MKINKCKCGCLITPASIVDYKCDGCYFKIKSERRNETKMYHDLKDGKADRMARAIQFG